MAIVPLSHHEILGLIEPFARRGRRADLAGSDRLARRLAFRPLEHDGDGLAYRETLELDSATPGVLHLTRTLAPADGPASTLSTSGDDPAALLAAIEAVPHARQLRTGPGFVVASSHRLETSGVLRLTHGATSVAGTTLALTMPGHRGRRAEVSLSTRLDDPIELPEDLLAVLGRDWSGLDRWTGRTAVRWVGSVRLRGRGDAADADAERKLERAALHVAATLAEPPARFHEKMRGARWVFAFRRAIPLLVCIGLIVAAFAFTKAGMAQDSIVRMLLFNAPPLMLVAFFCLRELPRIEVPKWPRRPDAAAWRPPDNASTTR